MFDILNIANRLKETKPRDLYYRIRLEVGGGAWCPAKRIAADVLEYLQLDLGRLKVITHVETQGRFGNGQVSVRYYRCTHTCTCFFYDLFFIFYLTKSYCGIFVADKVMVLRASIS